ncbi:transcription elongation factor GreA [Myxococcota bacterium]|nr:transcription elongation factor GreA [Myxococcota bacterium]
METYPVTPKGKEIMRAEHDQLKRVERPKISLAIGAAIEMGDLSENFEYHSAKDRQGMIEAQIRNLSDKLSRCQVIDPTTLSGDRVLFGATVLLIDIETDDEITYQIVGEPTANIAEGRISVQSPLARALIGKEEGDEVRIPGKGGPRMVEIGEVKFV